MRVAVYYKNDDIRLEDRPKPEIGPGEILIKVTASGNVHVISFVIIPRTQEINDRKKALLRLHTTEELRRA